VAGGRSAAAPLISVPAATEHGRSRCGACSATRRGEATRVGPPGRVPRRSNRSAPSAGPSGRLLRSPSVGVAAWSDGPHRGVAIVAAARGVGRWRVTARRGVGLPCLQHPQERLARVSESGPLDSRASARWITAPSTWTRSRASPTSPTGSPSPRLISLSTSRTGHTPATSGSARGGDCAHNPCGQRHRCPHLRLKMELSRHIQADAPIRTTHTDRPRLARSPEGTPGLHGNYFAWNIRVITGDRPASAERQQGHARPVPCSTGWRRRPCEASQLSAAEWVCGARRRRPRRSSGRLRRLPDGGSGSRKLSGCAPALRNRDLQHGVKPTIW
jgi:hypothetical protein